MLCLCFRCESGLKKTDMHVVRQTAFYCYYLNTASLSQIQFTFHRKSIKQKFLICEDCVTMASKSFCFSHDEKSSYSNKERLQLAELVEQFKKEHLKENETLEGKTRYDKTRKKHVPVVTHGNFVPKAMRKFYSNLSDKPNFVQTTQSCHSLPRQY